jgi:hypothetical protein
MSYLWGHSRAPARRRAEGGLWCRRPAEGVARLGYPCRLAVEPLHLRDGRSAWGPIFLWRETAGHKDMGFRQI